MSSVGGCLNGSRAAFSHTLDSVRACMGPTEPFWNRYSREASFIAMFLWTASISSALSWTEVRGVCAGVVAAEAVLFFLEEDLTPVSLKKVMLKVRMCWV